MMIGNPQSNRVFLAFQDFWHFLAGGKNKSKWTWDMVLDETVLWRRNGPCIFAQIRKIAAYEGEIGF